MMARDAPKNGDGNPGEPRHYHAQDLDTSGSRVDPRVSRVDPRVSRPDPAPDSPLSYILRTKEHDREDRSRLFDPRLLNTDPRSRSDNHRLLYTDSRVPKPDLGHLKTDPRVLKIDLREARTDLRENNKADLPTIMGSAQGCIPGVLPIAKDQESGSLLPFDPATLELLAFHNCNPVIMAIRAFQFDLLQKQVQSH
jgi:hypothetical protein